MKNIKYLLTAALVVLFCASCHDFLDVKPIGKMIPTKVAEFENLLNNGSTLGWFMMDNNKGCSYAMMGDNLEMSENQYVAKYINSFPNEDVFAAYIFYTPIYKPTTTPFAWSSGMFTPLGIFNNVIDGVEGIDTESDFAKGVIAQAKAGRAWLYMNIALTYGPMYDPNGANDTPVLPLRTSGDPTTPNGPLATTAEIYAQVKADLDYACEYAPMTQRFPARADRAAAYGLRAEYHMFTRDWNNMLKDCQKAWEIALANNGSVDNMIYDMRDFYYEDPAGGVNTPTDGSSPEYYMTLRGPENFDQPNNNEILLYRETPGTSYGTGAGYYPSQDWKSIFDQESDLRWIKFMLKAPGFATTIAETKYDDGVQPFYLRFSKVYSTQSLTYPLLLLMKAEAEARTGDNASALADLNTLRKYRYDLDNTDLTGLTGDALLEEILKERRREQPLCSFQRTVDLKRYAFDSGKPWSKSVIEHKAGSKSFTKSITDAYFQSLPIDNAILQYNPQWGIPLNNDPYAPYDAK